MRLLLADLLCCPACRTWPMELTALETVDVDRTGRRVCERSCTAEGRDVASSSEACGKCLAIDVETGFLFCDGCERFYFVVNGIPRLLTEDFAKLIDRSVPERFPDAFGHRERELEAFISKLETDRGDSGVAEWNLEDVSFWEDQVYGDSSVSGMILDGSVLGRPDAGNRTYPRERAIFSRLRPEVRGGVLLDLGCGLSQTVRVLYDPAQAGYTYIGADLSLNALRLNRATLLGDYVQCTVDQLPFRASSVDAVLSLGALHHLANAERALEGAMDVVRPGGWIALDEVVSRPGRGRRVAEVIGLRERESVHNESVSLDAIDRRITPHASLVVKRREYSPVRGILARFLSRHMPTRPLLTTIVLAADAIVLATLGRISSFFAGREILLLARKQDAQNASAPHALGEPVDSGVR